MRIFTLTLLSLASLILVSSSVVSANINDKICTDDVTESPICSASGSDDPIAGEDGVIMRVATVIAWVVGVVSVIMIILSGFRFVTSAGNSEAVSSARNTILYSLVGLVIAALSQVIVRFVLNLL